MPQLLTDESELPGQDDLKDAITASLGTGIFINYKIYAPVASVQPSDLPSLQPLHFCSFVNPGVLQKVTSGTVLWDHLIHQTKNKVIRIVGAKAEPQLKVLKPHWRGL